MIEYRLLVAHEVIVFLDSLKAADRKRLIKRFLEITSYPAHYADYSEMTPQGAGSMSMSMQAMRLPFGRTSPTGT